MKQCLIIYIHINVPHSSEHNTIDLILPNCIIAKIISMYYGWDDVWWMNIEEDESI
jgi:hypothetical protein